MKHTLALAAALLATFSAHADSGRAMPAQVPKAYTQECAACHVAYPPGMLPAASWRRVMTGLDKHYGTDASLDPATADSVMSQLHGICKSDRLTAVVSLHQTALARRYADRIVGLCGGRVVFDGPPSALTPQREAELYASASGAAADAHPLAEAA